MSSLSQPCTGWKLSSIHTSPNTTFLRGILDFHLTRKDRVVVRHKADPRCDGYIHEECSDVGTPLVSHDQLSLPLINCVLPHLFQDSVSEFLDDLGVDPAAAQEIITAILCFLHCAVGRPVVNEFHISVALEVATTTQVVTAEEIYDR